MPTTADRTSSTTTYVLTSAIVDNVVVLSGSGLVDNVLTVPSGSDAIVSILDTAGFYLYASTVPSGGGRADPWDRQRTQAQTRFNNVGSTIDNIVYAADSTNPGKVKYGPVLKIKPQG
jgi:hypothetical protein